MRLPFVKAKTAALLQQKLDAARCQLAAVSKELAATRKELGSVQKKLFQLSEKAVAPAPPTESPEAFPRMIDDPRTLLSLRFLHGEGLEIGALHRPTPTAPGVSTKYYDYLSAEDNHARCTDMTELGYKFVPVDYIGDGEKLDLIEDDSLDHLIANHMLEHCQDPIGTLRVFMRKLRWGGALLIALPDKRYTLDYRRQITPFEHLVQDHLEGPGLSLYDHYLDVNLQSRKGGASKDSKNKILARDELLNLPHVDIHFHVWTQFEILEMFMQLRSEFEFPWEFEGFLRHGGEVVLVLRKERVEVWDRGDPSSKPVPE